MPTFRVIAAALICAALSGCSSNPFAVSRAAPTSIELPDGMVVTGASGWCVDPSVSRPSGDTAVVVLGSCAAIGQNALAPRPDVPGVVTVSVEREGAGAPTPAELESFFVSETGRAALARDGRAESVEILETRTENNHLILHTEDRKPLPGASPRTWRALFALGGRFVSVTLYGLLDEPFDPDDGLATLEAQVARLIAANDG